MSAPIIKTTITSPYRDSIESCRECLEACRHFLDNNRHDNVCRAELRTLVATLGQAIRLMENNSRFTPRYLVDCAEICASCARRCEKHSSEAYQRVGKVCRDVVVVCQRASLIES